LEIKPRDNEVITIDKPNGIHFNEIESISLIDSINNTYTFSLIQKELTSNSLIKIIDSNNVDKANEYHKLSLIQLGHNFIIKHIIFNCINSKKVLNTMRIHTFNNLESAKIHYKTLK